MKSIILSIVGYILLFLTGCAPAFKGETVCTIPETTVYIASDYQYSSSPTMRKREFLTKPNKGNIKALSDDHNKAIWLVGTYDSDGVYVENEYLGHEVLHLLKCHKQVHNPDA